MNGNSSLCVGIDYWYRRVINYRRFQGNWSMKMGILDGDVNHSNMRWLGHITMENN